MRTPGAPSIIPFVLATALAACSHSPIRLGSSSGDVSTAMSASDVLTVLQVDPALAMSAPGNRAAPACYDYRTSYGRIERSVGGMMSDRSSFYVDVASENTRRPSDVSVFRSWPDARRVRVSSSDHGAKPNQIKVVLWRNTKDRHPATMYFPKDGPVGARIRELGSRALTISCARTATPRRVRGAEG